MEWDLTNLGALSIIEKRTLELSDIPTWTTDWRRLVQRYRNALEQLLQPFRETL